MAVTQTCPTEVFGSAPLFPRYVDAMVLGAGTAESYTAPVNAGFCIITADAPVYGKIGGTAVIPTTEVADGSASFYIPAGVQFRLEGSTALSLIRAGGSSTIVTIAVYKA